MQLVAGIFVANITMYILEQRARKQFVKVWQRSTARRRHAGRTAMHATGSGTRTAPSNTSSDEAGVPSSNASSARASIGSETTFTGSGSSVSNTSSQLRQDVGIAWAVLGNIIANNTPQSLAAMPNIIVLFGLVVAISWIASSLYYSDVFHH
eukprot:jgi/Chrzof1/11954/Cz06g15260.t1